MNGTLYTPNPNKYESRERVTVDWRTGERYTETVYAPIGSPEGVAIPARRRTLKLDMGKVAEAIESNEWHRRNFEQMREACRTAQK